MVAFITGASSGIGKDMAIYLGKLGYDIIVTGRNKDRLEEIRNHVNTRVIVFVKDLSNVNNCKDLYEEIKKHDIDVFINNAGFGDCGYFNETDLEKDIAMINTNIIAMHVLFKLILKDMMIKNKGYILNVSSLASFMPGPLMSTYYSTKAYVTRLSESVIKELNKKNSNVGVSILCPGPTDTNFNKNMGAKFKLEPLSSEEVAKEGIDKMFKNKKYIIPGVKNTFARRFSKIIPTDFLSEMVFKIQNNKINK